MKKHLILCIIFFLPVMIVFAQQEKDTEVIIITGEEEIETDEIEEIIIKTKKGNIKIKPEDISIMKKRNGNTFNFGGFNFGSDFFGDMGEHMLDINEMMLRLGSSFDDFNFEEFPEFRQGETLEDFDKELNITPDDTPNAPNIQDEKVIIGTGRDAIILRSDDGGEIISNHSNSSTNTESKTKIKRSRKSKVDYSIKKKLNIRDGEEPLVFLDGKKFTGDLDSINAADIRSISMQQGNSVTRKYGEEAKYGVLELKTF